MANITVKNPNYVDKSTVMSSGSSTNIVVTAGLQGPPGPRSQPEEYLMPVAQTTATFDHTLGHNPTSVQVILDGQVCEEFSVTFPIAGQRVQVGFDISVQALIRVN